MATLAEPNPPSSEYTTYSQHFTPNRFLPGTAESVLANLFPSPDPYASDPVAWIQDRLKEHIWSKQQEIAKSVRDNKYTAVKACHGPGKSFIAARIVAWWLSTNELGSAFAVTTAPSWPQVQAILWREIRRAHNKAALPGRITLECHWYMKPYQGHRHTAEELIAMGRKPQDYDESAFQGIHARKVLVVIDEACGIPKALWDAVKTLVTNDYSRVLAIGNPDDPASEFANICNPGSGFNVIKISAFDSPNFTGEPIPAEVQDVLVSPGWVEERRIDWGEGSNLWRSKVEGEFPDISDEFLIPPAFIQRAHETDKPGFDKGKYGIDIARLGTDKSVIYRNRGGQIRKIDSWAKMDTMETARRIANILSKHGEDRVPAIMDVIGLGSGPYDRLRELGLEVGGFEGSGKAFIPGKFANRRAEVYWMFRRLLEEGEVDLDPQDTTLSSELQSIKYMIDAHGRIVIESKDDMRKRGILSPDHADAAVMSTVHFGDIFRINHESIAGDLLSRVM
jgi:hypothetical protein